MGDPIPKATALWDVTEILTSLCARLYGRRAAANRAARAVAALRDTDGLVCVPPGTIVRGWTVRLKPTPEQVARFRRDCGARRFARNWAVAQIMQAFEAGSLTGEYDGTVRSAYSPAPNRTETRTPERIWRVSRPVRPRRRATVRPGLPGTSR